MEVEEKEERRHLWSTLSAFISFLSLDDDSEETIVFLILLGQAAKLDSKYRMSPNLLQFEKIRNSTEMVVPSNG